MEGTKAPGMLEWLSRVSGTAISHWPSELRKLVPQSSEWVSHSLPHQTSVPSQLCDQEEAMEPLSQLHEAEGTIRISSHCMGFFISISSLPKASLSFCSIISQVDPGGNFSSLQPLLGMAVKLSPTVSPGNLQEDMQLLLTSRCVFRFADCLWRGFQSCAFLHSPQVIHQYVSYCRGLSLIYKLIVKEVSKFRAAIFLYTYRKLSYFLS